MPAKSQFRDLDGMCRLSGSYHAETAEMKNEIVIPREKAVFWLDGDGRWHNAHGPFQHKKIIDYFHASIQKDQNGYYLFQETEERREKVYFRYDDTALFVFDVIQDDSLLLVLNTGERLPLRPEGLFVENDALYFRRGEERIKFTQRCLMKISDRLEIRDDAYFIRIKSNRYRIAPP
jgi:hypothetical protein